MNRRDFVRNGVGTLAGLSLAGSLQGRTVKAEVIDASPKKRIGIQLYSLRDDMGKDPDATLKEVARIGYSEVEGYGYGGNDFFGRTPSDFKSFVESLGMKMTSVHTGLPLFHDNSPKALDTTKRIMENSKIGGCKWVTQAGYPGGKYTKLDEVKRLADQFNQAGELAKTFGLKFAYHNHREEFRAIENQIPYQKYLDWTDQGLVSFQMDIGHVANEMADYLTYLQKYPKRFGCLHVRDTNIFTKVAVEFGDGDVRMKEVFELFNHAGVEDFYVEQEEYNYAPIESLRMCYDYLAKSSFVQ